MQEILKQPRERIRFCAPLGGAFQIQQPCNLSRVSHVTTREQVGETLHVVIRQIGHRHALTENILGSAVQSAKLNFINLVFGPSSDR